MSEKKKKRKQKKKQQKKYTIIHGYKFLKSLKKQGRDTNFPWLDKGKNKNNQQEKQQKNKKPQETSKQFGQKLNEHEEPIKRNKVLEILKKYLESKKSRLALKSHFELVEYKNKLHLLKVHDYINELEKIRREGNNYLNELEEIRREGNNCLNELEEIRHKRNELLRGTENKIQDDIHKTIPIPKWAISMGLELKNSNKNNKEIQAELQKAVERKVESQFEQMVHDMEDDAKDRKPLLEGKVLKDEDLKIAEEKFNKVWKEYRLEANKQLKSATENLQFALEQCTKIKNKIDEYDKEFKAAKRNLKKVAFLPNLHLPYQEQRLQLACKQYIELKNKIDEYDKEFKAAKEDLEDALEEYDMLRTTFGKPCKEFQIVEQNVKSFLDNDKKISAIKPRQQPGDDEITKAAQLILATLDGQAKYLQVAQQAKLLKKKTSDTKFKQELLHKQAKREKAVKPTIMQKIYQVKPSVIKPKPQKPKKQSSFKPSNLHKYAHQYKHINSKVDCWGKNCKPKKMGFGI